MAAKFSQVALVSVLAGVMLLGVPAVSLAQTAGDGQGQIINSLDLEQVDAREAIRALFKNVEFSYSIEPTVQGTVTVNLRKVTFEAALQNILKQIDATYRIEGGVYQIMRREDPPAPVTSSGEEATQTSSQKVRRRIQVRHGDPMVIAILLGTDKGKMDFSLSPERSTVINTPNGLGGGATGPGNGSNRGGSPGGNGGFGRGNNFGGGGGGRAG